MSTSNILLRASLRSKNSNGHNTFLPSIRKLVFEYCDKWPTSQNTRTYLLNNIQHFARQNPHVEVVVKQRNHKEPIVRGFYVNNRDKVISLKDLEVTAIQKKVQLLLDSSGTKIVPLKRRTVESPPHILPFTNMTMAEDDLSFASTLSTEDIAWLKESIIIDSPPTPPPKNRNRYCKNTAYIHDPTTDSSHLVGHLDAFPLHLLIHFRPQSSLPEYASFVRKSTSPQTPPRKEPVRSEWLYRRPKSPMTRSTDSSPQSFHGSSTGSSYSSPSMARSLSNTSSITTRSNPRIRPFYDQSESSSSLPSQDSFWPNFFGPRPRSERSVPVLKTIPSNSQLGENSLPSPSSHSVRITTDQISAPRPILTRPPSVSSTLSSLSTYSSRSESPTTPVSVIVTSPSSFVRNRRPHPYHYQRRQRKPVTHDTSPMPSSCPPSRSILSRSPSVSTKSSIPTTSKSVKFAAIPIVHYASKEFWELDAADSSMGINVDSMDIDESCEGPVTDDEVDEDEHDSALFDARFRDLVCATPTPEREKEKTRGLKRLVDMAKKPIPLIGTNNTAHRSPPPSKAIISAPYQLGAYPTQLNNSTTSLGSLKKSGYKQPRQPDFSQESRRTPSLRMAPSMESFRSSKSATARSVRSMGSYRSSASTRGLRSWLTRTLGWAET
ncbi:hypothetical protein CVT24_003524 [Panaeolus cyanescens]|uniref:Large ribosomal subunit protein mL43 n=1 Tax=Panaeolus cyanescens TaxID=181874 RepID=A0A409Y7K5_9AGAR|nr:hypothetical protein CVT24_003524 [Panaeolus cyanescens]